VLGPAQITEYKMGLNHSPSIVTEGLVMCLDAGNPKSFNPNLLTTLGAFNYPIGGTVSLDLAPDGTIVLCQHNLTGLSGPFMNARVDRTLVPGTYTISAWLKGTTSFGAAFAYVGETTGEIYATTANITTSWQRFIFTFTVVATQNNSRVQLFFGSQGDNKIVSIWGVELVAGSTSTPNYILSNFRGVNCYDLNNNVNNGTLINGVAYNSGNGGALVFNGTNNYASVTNSASLQVGETFSVSAWVYPTNLSSRYPIFSTRTANASGSWQLELGTGNAGTGRIAVTGVGTWIWESSSNVISANNFYNITYVKPNNATQGGNLYLNGILLSPLVTTAYTILNNSDAKLTGAGTSLSQFFPGNIYSVSLYNQALSPARVLQNFNALKGRYGL
jgi:hypothetical protein